jgi:starch-binding outer membrane protein, SusD/RagB family
MNKHIIFIATLLVGIFFTSNSCTDLDEIILDETSATGLTDNQAAQGNLAPVYAALPSLFQHTTYFALQEISTDEAILPYRGGTDWGDNGIYVALHTHTLTSADPNVRNTWTILLTGISRAVTAMNALPTNPDPVAKTYLAEARGMRAYYNLVLLDLFGLVFVKDDLGEISTVLRGTAAVDHLKAEFLAVEPNLESNVGPGRLTKAGVWGLLARLHLNAAVYRDPYAATFDFKAEDMDKVIEYSDKIISGGQNQLVADYFSIFNMDNHTNKELVFAVDQRAELNGHNRLAYFSLSGDQFPLAAFPGANGTDGPAITPDFYRTWVNAYAPTDPAEVDPRFYRQNWTIPADSCVDGNTFNMNRGILRGQQYGFVRVNGAFVKCADGKLKVGKLYNTSRNKPTLPVNFTEDVNYTVAGSNYSQGFRVLKYEFSKKSASGRNLGDVDLPIVRLADVYLMRAEAKLRKSNDAAGALADVNAIRAARTFGKPAPALTSMNLDLLFRERGFELYWELLRRTDMIRFNKYEGVWTEKNNADKFKRLFPIPQTAIDGASNIPGYLKQNQSY